MKYLVIIIAITAMVSNASFAQKVDYSIVSVPEESGIEFLQITTANDYVCMPQVKRSSRNLSWFANRIIDISKDGNNLAYLSVRNNMTNIFVKELGKQGSSLQRTNRQSVLDFSYSNDGKYICFTEQRGKTTQVFQTDANIGFVCRQITSGANDYTPIYNTNMKNIFFARQEKNGVSIWSYDIDNNFLSTYTAGMTPYPIPNTTSYLCTRPNATGKTEIWKVEYSTGIEECIVSDVNRGFSTPVLSPDGQWILMVGESIVETPNFSYRNTDIYVCRTDGTYLSQLTYHAGDDLSPVWSKDGRFIYFISQRGSAEGTANVWRMSFTL